MIIKIQRPLASSSGARDEVLIYAAGRKHQTIVAMTKGLRKLMGDSYKIYVEAEFKDGKWVIGKVAPDQSW